MKKIINHLKENWIRHGFETLVIINGILIAFALNNWNEGRKRKLLEIKLLKDLVEVAYRNNDDVVESSKVENQILKTAKVLKYAIENDLPYSDSLSTHLYWIENYTTLWIDYSAYEAIKDQGLNIISNDSIRLRIAAAFSQGMDGILANEKWREERVLGLFDLEWFKSMGVPVDFEKLKKDSQFNYLVDFQIEQAKFFKEQYAPPGMWQLNRSRGTGFIPTLEAEIARLEGLNN